MMPLAEHIPKTPEISFMARPKSSRPRGRPPGRQSNTQYYLNKQPPDLERWDHMQFRQWIIDMGYEAWDARQIAGDLGLTTNRVNAYWRGHEKGKTLILTKTLTKLCKALLELKRRGKGGG